MRIGLISDLHFDYNQNRAEANLIQIFIGFINQHHLAYLFIIGDITSYPDKTLDVIAEINQQTDTKVFFVPGNHDVWSKGRNALAALEKLMASPYSLTDKTLELTDNWLVVGAFPWYDYSTETLGEEQSFYHSMKHMWADARYVDWQMSDVEFHQLQMKKIEKVIKSIPNEKKIIFLEHFVPRKEFIKFIPDNDGWNFGSAYMGSTTIGELCEQYSNIKVVSFGHTHQRFGVQTINNIEYICNPVGYVHEWKTNEFAKELASCLTIKELI